MQCAQAARAHIETPNCIAISNGYLLDIGQPATISSFFGMAYVVTVLWFLSTDIAFY